MSQPLKIVLVLIAAFLGITVLHVWLNIGFDKLGLTRQEGPTSVFRVGYLPVT
jgi:hypothetical protein